eukprot:7787894-Pyramimonas_sp.AAC.1
MLFQHQMHRLRGPRPCKPRLNNQLTRTQGRAPQLNSDSDVSRRPRKTNSAGAARAATPPTSCRPRRRRL